MKADEQQVVEIARGYLDGLLADSVSRTDVAADAFLAELKENSGEILAEASEELGQRDELHTRLASARWQFVFQTVLGLVSLAVAGIFFFGLGTIAYVVVGLVAAVIIAPFLKDLRAAGWPRTIIIISPREPLAPLGEKYRAARDAASTMLRRVVLEWLSARIDLALGEIYSATLPALNPTGLAEVDDPDREIPTQATEELEAMIERMPAGSIGIAGPRGAGKTTLLHRVTRAPGGERTDDEDGAEDDRDTATGIVVDAPVEYDARDFILHLFARLCEKTLGPDRVIELRGWNRAPGLALPSLGPSASRSATTVGPLLVLLGGLGYLATRSNTGSLQISNLRVAALFALGIGASLMYMSFLSNFPGFSRFLQAFRPSGTIADNPAATAEIRLRQIWFQQSISTGWSGGLKLPFGFSLGSERGSQLAEKQLSLPDIVALYKEFARLLAARGEVRIGIDELDKMDDERARRFLNEIKVIFRTENCFYLVSVSEDAMSYFERRGLPFRDVFDSSFDEVMQVGYLSFEHTHRLLRRRVVGLPLQFVGLCHVLGGGLARDVIRVARNVCDSDSGSDIRTIATSICRRQVRAKCEAARVAMRRLRDPEQISLLGEWLRGLGSGRLTTATMIQSCRTFADDFLEPLGEPPAEDAERLADYREAQSIALEVIAFVYFVASLLEFLPQLETGEGTRAAIEGGGIEALAEARQAFAHNPSEAWEAISALRGELPQGQSLDFPRAQLA